MISTFWLDGVCAADFGIIMREPPPYVVAERDIQKKTIPGRSGDVLVDKGRYKNVSVPYTCAIIPEPGVGYRTAVEQAAELLRPTANYMRLINTYDPEHFREARMGAALSVESIMEEAGNFKIAFDCKPQRWLLSGRRKIRMQNGGTLLNPTGYPARPIITVYGDGPGVLTVGGTQCRILSMDEHITLDTENESARKGTANKNSCVAIADFPILDAGRTGITWDGGITAVEIEARWWTL